MGLFDRFKKKPEDEPEETAKAGQTAWPPVMLEIAEIISSGDEAVLREVTACTSDPAGYFSAHQERYEERNMDATCGPELIQWLGLVDILMEHNYVCERDWKDELPDFLYFLQHLRGTERLGLTIQEDWLDEDGDVDAWCSSIIEKWKPQQCRVAEIGIDSDSYVLFSCRENEWERLKALSKQLGQDIY